MKNLSLKKSKELIWLTWVAFLIVGGIVVLCTNPINWFGLILAGGIALCAIINFWEKSEYIPIERYSVVPALFMPSAFFSCVSALVIALLSNEGIMDSWAIGCAAMFICCIAVIYPESGYTDYD